MKIGQKLKALRIMHNLTMQELADRCNLSKGYISQLEHNLASPSIETLHDMLKVYDLDFATFFTKPGEKVKFVFKKSDFITITNPAYDITWLVANAQKLTLEPIIINLKAFAVSKTIMPFQGQIFGYVLKGSIIVYYDNERKKVNENECFMLKGVAKHYLKNNSSSNAKVLWISTPPVF